MPTDNPPLARPPDTSPERRGAIQERHEWHRRHLRYNEPFDAVEDLLAMLAEAEANRDEWEARYRMLNEGFNELLQRGVRDRRRAVEAEAREAALRAALQATMDVASQPQAYKIQFVRATLGGAAPWAMSPPMWTDWDREQGEQGWQDGLKVRAALAAGTPEGAMKP